MDINKLREVLGICSCGKAMTFYRRTGKMICRSCTPNLPPDRDLTPEEKKKEDDWYDAEHEHMPA
jgi:hypothetical protein